MKWLLIIAGIIACLVIIVVIAGYMLPVKHTATVIIHINAVQQDVWNRITTVEKYPEWRKDVKSVTVSSPTEWTEEGDNGKIPFKVREATPYEKWTSEISDKKLPFGGNWVYVLEAENGGTRITITENGEVYNPVFRFMSRYIMGHTATLNKYGTYLQESFK